jgi:hypothetical protein
MLISGDGGTSYINSGAGNRIFALDGVPVPERQTWVALLVTVSTFGALRWWNRKSLN